MASEAKIGLLLGLAIIFVIAFVLNELPRFGRATDAGPLDGLAVDEPSGIGANVRNHINTNTPIEPAETQVANHSSQDNSEEATSYASLPDIPPMPPEPDEEPVASGYESIKQTISEVFYVVSEGDNLADIAKKFYGPIEGNRIVNVLRIFQANRKLLPSPHKIRVGQKLLIPRLNSSDPDEVTIGGVFPSWMFEKVESIGARHLSPENRRPRQERQYVVREGDNLWRVAASQLGDATRYKEISRLNADVLEDEDTLLVGMLLKLPAQ